MKKMSLLFAMLLVLVSSIVFCGCGNKYKKLSISLGGIVYGSETYYAKEGEISLVLDDPYLSKCGVTFNISGVKEWGAVSVTANPAEVIKVESCATSGKTCSIGISALQPVDGGELIVTHMGSGKNCKVPLNIGKKLQDIKSNGNSYVLQRPNFEKDESSRLFEIPTDDLLVCNPLNYTDLIIWQQSELSPVVNDVRIISYDRDGKEVEGEDLSYAIKSVISIGKNCPEDATLTITPLSILDGEIKSYDESVVVHITSLLEKKDVVITSKTHGDTNDKLHELALISNPAENSLRKDIAGYIGYDLYSTAVIEFQANNPDFEKDPAQNMYIQLSDKNDLFKELYDVTVSTDIQGLTLEYLGFVKIRAIATSTCYGEGEVVVRFSPKNSVGDIESFEINIPCTVGERATSYSVSNNGQSVVMSNSNYSDYDFQAITPLNDSNSVGQAFKFEMLSTNTLSALKQYKITIHKDLLYINPEYINEGKSPYITNGEKSTELYELTPANIKGNRYQISILKDGNQIKFYNEPDNSNYFISEPLSSRNVIYIKWNLNKTKDVDSSLGFGISVSNWYSGEYDGTIKENKFGETLVKLKLDFNRQRTVGSMEYYPASATYTQGGDNLWNSVAEVDAAANWQFYLSNDMLNDSSKFYGIFVDDVFGLNNETLNADEKANINVKISTNCDNLGFAILNIFNNTGVINFKNDLVYNYDKTNSDIILIGKIDATKDIVYGDYSIEFRQAGSNIKSEPLINRSVTIYKPLTEDDVDVNVPLADFSGDVLEYVRATGVTASNYSDYYVYSGGAYKLATVFDPNTIYYQKNNDLLIDVTKDNVYVLATSSQYVVRFNYDNVNFIGEAGISVNLNVEGDLIYNTNNMCGTDQEGNQIIKTGLIGTFYADNDKENFIHVTYTISVYKYDYYQRSNSVDRIDKDIYIYVYKPITKALLNRTSIEKYDFGSIGTNSDLKEIYGTESLTLTLNDNDSDAFNYANVIWSSIGGRVEKSNESETGCKFTFYNSSDIKVTGRLIATINQFGIQIPVYCSYSVQKPIISEKIELNTSVNVFKSGEPYINLKAGESKQFSATVKGKDNKLASFNEVEYALCSQSGTRLEDIATISSTGLLQAVNPGKAKLIIIAKDSVEVGWKDAYASDYLTYIDGKSYLVIDVLITDGSVYNPYLITNSTDFKNISKDFVNGVNDKHYVIVANVNLNGQGVTFDGEFEGSISSFKQYDTDDTRFKISGIMLTSDNPVLFTELSGTIENVDFVLDINYTENPDMGTGRDVLIGLIGSNDGIIKDVTVIANGNVVADCQNSYTIGSLAAINNNRIELSDPKLVAVEANIKVEGKSDTKIVLGGIIGENLKTLIGGQVPNYNASGEMYSKVYYGKQGITAYVHLQVTESKDGGALGGAVGYNNAGTLENVLTDGTVYGTNNVGNGNVDNVGGIIGKNIVATDEFSEYIDLPATVIVADSGGLYMSYAEFTSDNFQIEESYSTAKVKGRNNVGGAVGHDTHGKYKHVYYEMYASGEGVVGYQNVGGLIGSAYNSDLLYCYANNFGWGYVNDVITYDIIGNTNVGGLVGFAESHSTAPNKEVYTDLKITTIISCASSVTIEGTSKVAGLVGLLADGKFGAIYTAYYHGVIKAPVYEGIVNHTTNMPYSNVYSKIKGVKTETFYAGAGFGTSDGQNNDEPYVVKGGGNNIINPVPSLITINDALQHYYRQDKEGEYYKDGAEWELYTGGTHTRYTLIASVIDAESSNPDISDYRKKALILYYYGLTNMADEDALEATYEFNKINMHDIVADGSILVVPTTLKRFTLKSSDPSVARVLDDGYLLLLNEGQVTITLTSIINPSISASFVAIVRSKVKTFTLHSSASLHDDYNINGKTINIVKGSSKIIYPNVKSTIRYYDNEFDYKAATNMGTQITITCPDDDESRLNIKDFISLNGELIESESRSILYDKDWNIIYEITDPKTDKKVYTKLVYRIPFGIPITISVKEYSELGFSFEAIPYVVSNYKMDNGTSITPTPIQIIEPYKSEFTVSTKRGAGAINVNKHQLVMMPADTETNLNVKIATDTQQPTVYVDVEAINISEVVNPKDHRAQIKVAEMLDLSIIINNLKKSVNGNINPNNNSIKNYEIDILDIDLNELLQLQEFELMLKLNDQSHYINETLKLQVTIYLKDDAGNKLKVDGQYVQAVTFIDIEPQVISSMIALNYRLNAEALKADRLIRDENLDQSTLIRPGSSNIISIDIAPNIAVFDYIEIIDNSTTERILLRQVYRNVAKEGAYTTPANMDVWVDNGVKLRKIDSNGNENIGASQLFVEARLPIKSIANVTHTISIIAYRDGQAIYTTYLDIEAIAYPTIIMTYTPPKGEPTVADTSLANKIKIDEEGKIVVSAEEDVDLAVGVEAGVEIETYNIDDGSLTPVIKIYETVGVTEVSGYENVLKLEYRYGKYILLFNKEEQSLWNNLVGKVIHLTFTASKTLNGSIEYCEATIKFAVRKFVIHAVSMTHTSSQGDLYGDWDREFTRRFCFDKTDISYYNVNSNTYWNTKYELKDANAFDDIGNADLKEDLQEINDILAKFNAGFGGDKEIGLIDLRDNRYIELKNNSSQIFERIVVGDQMVEIGFSIKYDGDNKCFKIHAKDPSLFGGEDINNYQFNVRFKIGWYDESGYPQLTGDNTISNSFGFNVSKKTTPFDEYITIYTQAEFEDLLEGKFYQLGADITLTNYTPINVAIGGFNGGKYTMTVSSFNLDQLRNDYLTGDVNIGLFGTLAENSIVQNLKVVYSDVTIDLYQHFEEHPGNNVSFGGIAGISLGVITNVHVSGEVEIKADNIAAQLIDCGGITALNGDTTTETEKTAAITNSTVELDIDAIAVVGGIAATNNGKIANTNFNGKISSYMANTDYVSDVLTAGFVVNNTTGATISLSSVDFTTEEENIRSIGIAAGFVLDNSGTIRNCYINNARIYTQGYIGGFVYSSSGSIINSYSNIEIENSLFYSKFIYDTSTIGLITDSYCVSNSENNPKIPGLKFVKSVMISNTEWEGFVFADVNSDGLWTKTDSGPKLVSDGFNPNFEEYEDIYNIYDVETYEGWLGQFNADKNYLIEGIKIRIVRDIDFEAEGFVGNPTTVNKTLMSDIEGNDMDLRNFTIYKVEQDPDDFDEGVQYYVGLFKEIKNAKVRNLNLIPAEVKASGAYAVGVLAGVVNSSKLYNINIENDTLLVLGRNAVGGLAGIIIGNFEIAGITSNVSVLSSYRYGISGQYNLYLGKNVTGVAGIGNIDNVSYAGSVAGIVDGYGSQTPQKDINLYQEIRNIEASGSLVLAGENVGALFGLVCENTLIKDAHYTVPDTTKYQGTYVSGGLVGENRGIIQSCSIQAAVVNDTRASTESCFSNFSKVNGGITGMNIGGLIDNCTIDLDVCTKVDFATVGGVIGRNVEGSVYNTTLLGGRLKGYFLGGIVGADYSCATMSTPLTGEATISQDTLDVFYSLIADGFVEYNDNCVTGTTAFNKDEPFTNNIFSNKFMETFIKNKTYSYNSNHDNQVRRWVEATSVYGLVIGYSEYEYGLDYEYTTGEGDNKNVADYLYENNQTIVTLTLGDYTYNKPLPDSTETIDVYDPTPSEKVADSNSQIFKVKEGDKPLYIVCIKQVEDKTLFGMFGDKNVESEEAIKLIYLVATDNASGYEAWSTASGYSNKCILISET